MKIGIFIDNNNFKFDELIFISVKGEMILYADDTNVSFASAEISTLFQVVTEDLKLISEWLKHNRL
jgi:hypothetical protein